jgi:drug/metabolite transporter (DMT)-like permease
VFFVLLLITTGIVITAIAPDPAGSTAPAFDGPRAVALSIPVPVLFGVSLFATGEIGPHVSMLWAILPARLVGGLLIGLPLIVRRELRITRTVFPLVLIAAIAEILGFAAYVWGSHKQIAIAAVLASEYAALAAAGAFLVFGERLGKRQIAGLGIVGLGVALLGALTG